MTEVASAFVSLKAKLDRGFGSSLESQVGGEVEGSGKKVGGMFGKAVKFGATAAVGGAVLAAGFLKGSLDEAREAQKVGAVTNQIIKATGGAANVTSKQVGSLTSAISLKAGVDDEAIQSGANLLLTFKNVRNEAGKGNQVFNRATQAAVDLSAAGFGSITGASKQLGKALNDPVKGISALNKAGVTFTASQQEQIKALVGSGKTLQAQKIILREVESQVGGTAAAAATAGDKFKVAFGNLQESVGTAILPIIDGILGGLTSLAVKLTNDIGPGIAALNGYIAPVIAQIGQLFSALSSGGGGNATAALRSMFSALVSAGAQIGSTIGPALTQIGSVISTQLVPAFQRILPVVAPVVNFLVGIFASAVVGAIKGAVQAVQGFVGIISGVFNLIAALVHGDWSAAWAALKQIVVGAINAVIGIVRVWFNVGILSIFKGGVVRLLGSWRGLWTSLRGIVTAVGGAIRGAVSAVIQGVGRLFMTGVRIVTALWRGLFRLLLTAARAGMNAVRTIFATVLAAIRAVVQGAITRVKSLFTAGLNAIKTAVRTAMTAVKTAFTTAMTAVKTAVKNGIDKAREAFAAGVRKIVEKAREIGGKIKSAIGNIDLFAAGSRLIQGLVDGVGAKIGDAIQKVKDGLDKIKGLLPGSPIKWGPLKGWNNTGPTGPGGQLMGLLANGIANNDAPVNAASRLTSRISFAAPRVDAAQFSGGLGGTSAAGPGSGLTVNYNGPVYTHDPEDAARRLAARNRTAVALAGMP